MDQMGKFDELRQRYGQHNVLATMRVRVLATDHPFVRHPVFIDIETTYDSYPIAEWLAPQERI
jgi:hypothetical protein